MGSMQDFAALNKPPLSPPGWLFPIVWTVLYILMGIASYLVLETKSPTADKRSALKLYFLQLGFNFLWSIIFFTLGAYELAFLWLAILFVLIIATTLRFWCISSAAGLLMIPYAVWVAFAGYLNLAISGIN
jgi:tryptophan-rich sensory protein